MNRNKLKAYAPKARRDFIKAVTDRATFYGLTNDKIGPITVQGDVAIIGGKPFPKDVAEKRKRLGIQIRREGFEQFTEAMAYTWFNRFVAIRYMELHGYLEHGYRVLSHPEGNTVPEIVEHAEHVALPGLDQEKVIELKLDGTKEAALYRMLLMAQCNALNKAMPFLFEEIGNATELLLPENLLHSDSLIRKMVNEISEEEWEEVEIIGWLYQFYISEKKDQVIGKVVKSEDIPAATQLFTPNWIVKYMVQNTLGRQWVATYPNSSLKQQMEYYIEPAEQTPEVQAQLKAITLESLNPEELTLLDPACGSGHILVEAYDLFKAIYQERGYRAKDIPRLILENNLYGLEIDDRAAQLAAFALMMKARTDDRRIFEKGIRLHILAIQETKGMDAKKITEALNTPIVKGNLPTREMLFEEMDDARAPLFSRKNLSVKGEIAQDDVAELIELFEHGKTFGSLTRVPEDLSNKLSAIGERLEVIWTYGEMFGKSAAETIAPIVEQTMVLAADFAANVTNPPYMGSGAMNPLLKRFAKDQFPDSKADLFAMFIERNFDFGNKRGLLGMITMQSWMFLPSFQKIRERILSRKSITTMAHLGARAFSSISGEVVQTTSFVCLNNNITNYRPVFFRLIAGNEKFKKNALIEGKYRYDHTSQNDFVNIEGSPIAYWISKRMRKIFLDYPPLSKTSQPKTGLSTTDNEKFLRRWYEIDWMNIGFGFDNRDFAKKSGRKWFPFNKGGSFRKWYGNNEYVINWYHDGEELRKFIASDPAKQVGGRIVNVEYSFQSGITWGDVSTGFPSFRWQDNGYIYGNRGPAIFLNDFKLLGFTNSVLMRSFLNMLNPTLTFNVGNVATVPYKNDTSSNEGLSRTVQTLVDISRNDWNFSETAWGFRIFPWIILPPIDSTIGESFNKWMSNCGNQIELLQELETKSNVLFLQAYGLENELDPEVPEDQITLYRPNRKEDIKRLISYAIGCMMGRYSLDQSGFIYAHSGNNQFWEIYNEKHNKPVPSQNNNHSSNSCDSWSTFPPDQDGIIPITDTNWFPDDAANRFIQFISVAWPKEHLEENLKFVAESLNPKRGESPRETIRRYISTGFFKHHMKMYKKRPIYWLFSSGKLRAFQCLVYLHRYNESTLSRMRTEYVIPLQGKIAARTEQLSGDINAASSTAHRKKLERERDKLVKQQAELQTFDEKLRHYADQRISLDLDDGVKVNYGKFGDLLAEVKAVTGKKKKQ